MKLFVNLVLFGVLFLPLACATGVVGDLFAGPTLPPRGAYQLTVFTSWVLPLLLPSILAVPVAHFAYRAARRRLSPTALRFLAVVVTPFALLAVHLLLYGGRYWSLPLLAIVLLPGAIYGASFRIPASRPIDEST